jgi:ubiquitin-like 1-activating enzyme E1 B
LKNLALTGFKYIELIDLDTIDVSNLNRQFLFRTEHVGHPKAIVAGNAAKRFNPDITIVSYHDNIKSPKFNIAYFEKFNIVLNALDNIDARRHVNRLCLAANVPLIDSGTTGYLGQVMPIIKSKLACYECYPKPTQKVYPICTIRSTPDKPVHCIVWAKEFFKLLFNQPAESMLFEDEKSGDTSTYMHLIQFPQAKALAPTAADEDSSNSTDTRGHAYLAEVLSYGEKLLSALYNAEITKRLQMDVYKTAKIVPVPLNLDSLTAAVQETKMRLTAAEAPSGRPSGWDNKIYSEKENIIEFLTCLYEVASGKDAGLIGQLSFDKDDLWAMRFVACASNLRSAVFSIPTLSFHDAKGVAGNIIPAIATTNAIVAGVQVMQAVRMITAPQDLEGTVCIYAFVPICYLLHYL